MTKQEFIDHIEKTFRECHELVKRKNADYADQDPFKNFRNSTKAGVPIERGILVRLYDKMSRIDILLDKEPDVKDESLEDTLHDVINYTAILKAYLAEKKGF